MDTHAKEPFTPEWLTDPDAQRTWMRSLLAPMDPEAAEDDGWDRTISFGLVTADGMLLFASSTLRDLRTALQCRSHGAWECGFDSMPEVADLYMTFSGADAAYDDALPLNEVANRMVQALDPEYGEGCYRGTVAFTNGPASDPLTAVQRVAIEDCYQRAVQQPA